jgi:hypothetical protein
MKRRRADFGRVGLGATHSRTLAVARLAPAARIAAALCRRVRLSEMSAEPGRSPEPPPLPPALLRAWPFIVIGALGWLVAAATAFLVPALESWRPVTLAGLATGVIGTSIFLLQLASARRGDRGAQSGMETFLDSE